MSERNHLGDSREYLGPQGEPCWWCWQENGQELTWSNGITITFRQELRGVLARQADRGLPPLAPVLLLIASTRDSWRDSGSDLFRRFLATDVSDAAAGWAAEVADGLDCVHQLGQDFAGLWSPKQNWSIWSWRPAATALLPPRPRRCCDCSTRSCLKSCAVRGPT